jgi:hypothetical protein
MKHLKTLLILLMLLTSIIGSWTFAQDSFNSNATPQSNFDAIAKAAEAKEVPQERALEERDSFNFNAMFKFNLDAIVNAARARELKEERAREVMRDNEYTITGYEEGIFLSNPLMLDGKPLDYGEFNLASKGELTVVKGAATYGQTVQVPFYLYLRRNGSKVLISGKKRSDRKQIKIDISEILRYAEPGDHLVIEAVKKEDGSVKRILKLLSLGC